MTESAVETTLFTAAQANQMRKEYPLTALDRCDQCGAQAYVAVEVTKSLQLLMFCNHHWFPLIGKRDEDGDELFNVLRDDRSKLTERPAPLPFPGEV